MATAGLIGFPDQLLTVEHQRLSGVYSQGRRAGFPA